MFKNFNAVALGVSGRQSELIELALTYGFRGMDLDVDDFIKRVDLRGVEHASRYFESAKNLTIGSFNFPFDISASDDTYKANLVRLDQIGAVVQPMGGKVCVLTVAPGSNSTPYHENFEHHRARVAEIADVLDKHEVRLGLGFRANASARAGYQHQFIHKAEELLTLIKTIGSDNVGLALDSWHFRVGDGGLDQLSELQGSQFINVRLADAPADADLATIEEDQRLVPGDGGLVDNEAIVKLLAENGYAGPIAVIPCPGSFRGLTRDAIVQKTFNSLEDLFIAAGLSKPKTVAVPVGADEDEEGDEAEGDDSTEG